MKAVSRHGVEHPALDFLERVDVHYPNLWSLADDVQRKFRTVGHKEGCVFTKAEAEAVAIRLPGEALFCSAVTLGALIAWRPTKGIYRFHPTLYGAVATTSLDGDVPSDLLARLPGYSVFIEAPGLMFFDQEIVGFWAYLSSSERQSSLEIVALFTDRSAHGLSVPLGQHPVADLARMAVTAQFAASNVEYSPTDEEWERVSAGLSAMLSLLLYLCSEKPDIDGWEPPRPRAKLFGAKQRWLQAKEVRTWDVGLRIGAALTLATQRDEASSDAVSGTGTSVRPHIRRAHWHSFWVGKKAEQTVSLRWLPPIPVNVGDGTNLPAVIYPVVG